MRSEYGLTLIHGKQRVIAARPKFSRGSVGNSDLVHAVEAVYLRWWAGSYPDSLEVTVLFKCSGGRQPDLGRVRPLRARTKVTCNSCKRAMQRDLDDEKEKARRKAT